jgi:tRNA-Thr(GGU) m(6)t(6)A37 methyltransferase TsaA
MDTYKLNPIGSIRSPLKTRNEAPRQGDEGAPEAWIEILPQFTVALTGLAQGDEVLLFTWLHLSHRDVLEVHPRNETQNPLTGVFATRSPDRPNPIGLHRVRILEIESPTRLRVGPLEAVDGTPVIDLKPVLSRSER